MYSIEVYVLHMLIGLDFLELLQHIPEGFSSHSMACLSPWSTFKNTLKFL